MERDDIQKGRPSIIYKDTKANVEALTDVAEGATAYATDTNEPGWYNGTSWGWGTGAGGADPDAIHDNVAGEIHAITEELTPANDDELVMEKAASSYAKRRVKMSNLPGGTSGESSMSKVIAARSCI